MSHTSGVRILVADDDRSVREAIGRALRFEGYEVVPAADGREALEALAAQPADAVVLDVMMPRMDGLEVCRDLRARGDDTPILILTARQEISDRVAGLDAGADDYLVKPFALEELLARLRALLRRTGGPGRTEALRVADLTLDPDTRRVERGGRDVELTKTEFQLLELLMLNAGIVLTREVIYERRKTEAGDEPRLIHTVRGVGYVLREP